MLFFSQKCGQVRSIFTVINRVFSPLKTSATSRHGLCRIHGIDTRHKYGVITGKTPPSYTGYTRPSPSTLYRDNCARMYHVVVRWAGHLLAWESNPKF